MVKDFDYTDEYRRKIIKMLNKETVSKFFPELLVNDPVDVQDFLRVMEAWVR